MAMDRRRGSAAVRRATGVMATAAAAALAWFTALGPGCISTGGEGVDSCTSACNNREALGCSGACDCTKCSAAPSSCANALTCENFATGCSDFNSCPAPPADCAAFFATVCQ